MLIQVVQIHGNVSPDWRWWIVNRAKGLGVREYFHRNSDLLYREFDVYARTTRPSSRAPLKKLDPGDPSEVLLLHDSVGHL